MDLNKTCVDCNSSFVLTAGNQDYFISKGLDLPKRCEGCREARKAETKARKALLTFGNEEGGN